MFKSSILNPNSQIDLSTNEPQENIAVDIFPNPAIDYFTIETEVNSTFLLLITNLFGQKVTEKKFQKRTEVDVSAFGKGLFLVEVCDEKGVKCHTQQVVLE